jgi:hypothetical protein
MTMYTPPEFLTLQTMEAIVEEFEWPARYQLKELHRGAIDLCFERCTILFTEGYESEIEASFVPTDTGLERAVSVYGVLLARGGVDTPELSDYFSPDATLEKVQHGIRDLCKTLLCHFRASLLGDFDWVPAYREYLERSKAENA